MQIFFRWSYDPLLVLAAITAVLVLVYLSYKKTASRKTLALLFVLRTLSFLLLVFCIFQPVANFVETKSRKAYIPILIDTSKSMSLRDEAGGKRRLETAVECLLKSGVMEKLLSKCRVKCFEFSSGIKELRPRALKDVMEAAGSSTDIGGAVTSAASELSGQYVPGIIVLSDGQDNSGRDTLGLVKNSNIPLYTVGFGAKGDGKGKDIEIYHISAGKRTIVNNLTHVEVTVRNMNFDNKPVPVDLVLGDEVITSSVITLEGKEPVKKVKLAFTPGKVGKFVYTVRIPCYKEEISSENNRKSFCMRVTDPGIKVLYFEGMPRWEYKFLKRELENDASIEFDSFLRPGTGRLLKQGGAVQAGIPVTADEICKYDIIIFGDIEKKFFTQEQLEAVKTLVSEGGAFIMLGGNNSFGDGDYRGSPIEEILPVFVSGGGWMKGEFKLKLTKDGLSHPVFHSIKLGELPPLSGCNAVGSAKPGASVLAVDGNLIVIAVQTYGHGKSVAITTDSTWRWSLSGKGSGNFSLFWRQLLRWLHPEEKKKFPEEKKMVQVITDRDNYFCGDTAYIKIRVMGKKEAVEVSCTVNTPGHKEVKLALNSDPEGYSAAFIPRREGIYKVDAKVSRRDMIEGEDSISFIAGEPSLEFINTGLNDELLKKLSRESGGRYYIPGAIEELPGDIDIREKTVTYVREKKLWNNPWLFAAFLLFLALEWICRKRQQLM